jgi:hypothetical protein
MNSSAGLQRVRIWWRSINPSKLRSISGFPDKPVVNYGCPGESTVTFSGGRCLATAQWFPLHDGFVGTQLDAAVKRDFAGTGWALVSYEQV